MQCQTIVAAIVNVTPSSDTGGTFFLKLLNFTKISEGLKNGKEKHFETGLTYLISQITKFDRVNGVELQPIIKKILLKQPKKTHTQKNCLWIICNSYL